MPTRSQTMIRCDINRLSRLVQRHQDTQPVLAVVGSRIHKTADRVNQAWNYYQRAVLESKAERHHHDAAMNTLIGWIHRWRPAILLLAPDMESQLGLLSMQNATPREVIRLAENIRKIIEARGNGLHAALDDFGLGLAMLCQDAPRYTAASPCEIIARETFVNACNDAHIVLTRGIEIVRAVFGSGSREYRQFTGGLNQKEERLLMNDGGIGVG